MNIYIPKYIDCGLEVNLKPTGYYTAELHKTDGRVIPVATDKKNTILNNWRNKVMGSIQSSHFSDSLTAVMHHQSESSNAFYLGASNTPSTGNESNVLTGLNNAGVVAASGAPLYSYLTNMFTTTRDTIGNSIAVDPTSGDLIMSARKIFTNTGGSPVTVNEIAAAVASTGSFSGGSQGSSFCGTYTQAISRVVLDNPVTLDPGDTLKITFSLIFPTLAVTPQTVTLPAQNGMNLSGQLKLVGTTTHIAGGDVNASGTPSGQISFGGGSVMARGTWGLSANSTFPALNTEAPNLCTTVATTTQWSAYTTNTFYRDITGTFDGSVNTTFRSVSVAGSSYVGGYQLLLDSEQTKQTGKILNVALRISF